MNIRSNPDTTLPAVTTGPLPASRKVYVAPEAAPDLRVPVREIALSEGSGEPPLPVYDTSGVYTDSDVAIDVEAGLKRARIEWVRERGGVEEYDGRVVQPHRRSTNVARSSRWVASFSQIPRSGLVIATSAVGTLAAQAKVVAAVVL